MPPGVSGKNFLSRRHANRFYVRPIQALQYGLFLFGLGWLMVRGAERLGYNWQWYRIRPYFFTLDAGQFVAGPLLDGLAVTLKITGLGMVLMFAVGLLTAFFRLSGSRLARAVARTYLELVRNTPLLVQLFFIYFVLGPVLGIHRFTSAVLALGLFEGSYASEIFRSGILSIEKGQWEAAFSLGMSRYETYRHVILPLAFRRMLPPLTGQAVSLIKDSALVSTVAIYDLTMQGQAIVAETYLTFEIWFSIAAVYLALTMILSFGARFMESRIRG